MRIFKKIGRIFFVLTEEERYIKFEDIKAVLIVNLQEEHFEKTLEVTKKRFPLAEIKTIHSNTIIGIVTELWKLKGEQFNVVIVLSLNPLVISFVVLLFHCYLLIYNKFRQWFLIRRKTLYEFLTGRRGADKGKLDWMISPLRLHLVRVIIMISFLPFVLIKNVSRCTVLIIYILFNMAQLFLRSYYYKLFRKG